MPQTWYPFSRIISAAESAIIRSSSTISTLSIGQLLAKFCFAIQKSSQDEAEDCAAVDGRPPILGLSYGTVGIAQHTWLCYRCLIPSSLITIKLDGANRQYVYALPVTSQSATGCYFRVTARFVSTKS